MRGIHTENLNYLGTDLVLRSNKAMTRTISILLSLFLILLPVIGGSIAIVLRNEAAACICLLFALCTLLVLTVGGIVSGKAKNRNKVDFTLTDIAVCAYLLWGAVNIALVRKAVLDPFLIAKWTSLAGLYILVRHLGSKKVSFYAIALSGVVQSVIAILQHAGKIEGGHTAFAVTGSFGNPGPLGGYIAVCLTVTICLLWNKVKERHITSTLLLPIAVVLQLAGLYFADSRSALIASAAGVLYWLGKNHIILPKRSRIVVYIGVIFIVLIGGIALYNYRPASADSRFLIWNVSSQVAAERPLAGHGVGSFCRIYMPRQAEYFMEHPNSRYAIVADNVAYPYNELLHIAIEQGIIGLLLALALLGIAFFRSREDVDNRIAKCGLSALLIFSMFSYPASVFPLLALFPVLLGCVDGMTTFTIRPGKGLQIVSVTVITILLACSVPVLIELQERRKEVQSKVNGSSGPTERYTNLENIVPNCENYCLLADRYIQAGKVEQAEQTLISASYMIPTRVRPKYKLWELYLFSGDTVRASETARRIIDGPVKTESIYTLKVKREMKDFLDNIKMHSSSTQDHYE